MSDDKPLRTYVYLVEGEMMLGTVEDYAQQWKFCQESDLVIDGRLWILPEQEFKAVASWGKTDEDGYATVTIRIDDESADVVMYADA